MIIKASAVLRNHYTDIANLAKESQEPIYITKNGEGDVILMDIDAFERREQMLELRSSILQAEQERLNGDKALSLKEVKQLLNEQ